MTSTQIEKNLNTLLDNFSKEEFIYDLLLAYGISKTSVTRLKKGDFNLAKNPFEVLYKKKLFFKEVPQDQLLTTIDEVSKNEAILRHSPRFIIVTDYNTLLAKDINTHQSLDIPLLELNKHYDFFLPWAGQEKYLHKNENLADRKASYEMAKLYDILVRENPDIYDDGGHNLNIFLSRILFCFFAEDTGIFHEEGIFTTTLAQHTKEDGSDVPEFLDRFFRRLNTDNAEEFPAFLKEFPYVNGGLFRDTINSPQFSAKARKIILECGTLNWSDINPDIFGSMIQAVVNPAYRSGLGMHYTSVPNIMKVIEPLFLNELYEEFEKAQDSPKRLKKLIFRLSKIKIFDPACGSGNFLIIAYKELRRLEIQILSRLNEILPQQSIVFTEISLSNFYGIEIDDFAHEMAILSLWLAEHQMNKEFEEDLYDFGKSKPILPLKEAGHIVCGNATRLNWEEVCPRKENDETYILGNPPYLGARIQEKEHKEDLAFVFRGIKGYKNLDFISCWFFKGAKYLKDNNAKLAFVTTNSICQGEQVSLLWPLIFGYGLEINFAHQSFKWSNNAKGNAGVSVVIIGLGQPSNRERIIFNGGLAHAVKKINAYLVEGSDTIISKRSKPLSDLPEMSFGNMPNDGGGLIMSEEEKNRFLNEFEEGSHLVKELLGSSEFIRGTKRYCLWIENVDLKFALKSDFIKDRIERTRQHRINSKDAVTNELAARSHQFRDLNTTTTSSIIIPRVSSERRHYIPCGFVENNVIISDSAQAIYDAPPWVFGMVNSRMHLIWVIAIGGKLETRIRYSKNLCYNTFPFPNITPKQKEQLNLHVFNILEEREKHPEKTMAQLYDPDKMPAGLKEAHHQLDLAIERCYRLKPFESDTERLEYLFKEYERITTKSSTPGNQSNNVKNSKRNERKPEK